MSDSADVGIVVIGRNEGPRLRRCLESLQQWRVVYVDSGSTDGSAALAKSLGAEVVELDPRRPFSAARARNEGFARLRQIEPQAAHVQFVDGDCEVINGWVETAAARLNAHPGCAVVAGRLRERHPEASIYNRLCDLEWDVPAGEARSCGGVAMFRAAAFAEVGGFDDTIIAGEEPELCLRLRRRGWKIWRLKDEMALHDAAMTRFGQWWKRAVRGGYGGMDVARRFEQGAGSFTGQIRSARLWGIAWPAGTMLATSAGASFQHSGIRSLEFT